MVARQDPVRSYPMRSRYAATARGTPAPGQDVRARHDLHPQRKTRVPQRKTRVPERKTRGGVRASLALVHASLAFVHASLAFVHASSAFGYGSDAEVGQDGLG